MSPLIFRGRLGGRFRQTLWLTPSEEKVVLRIVGSDQQITHEEFITWDRYAPAKVMQTLKLRLLPRGTRFVLGLPANSFFMRSFDIPVAAAPHLASLALSEIERRTPFRSGDIFFHNWVESNPADHQKLQVHQIIIRRELVDTATKRLALGTEDISFIAPLEAPQLAHAIPVGEARQSENVLAKKIFLRLAIAAPLLLSVTLAVRWWSRETVIEELSARLPARQAEAQSVRRKLDTASQAHSMVRALLTREAMPQMSQIWEEVSQILPDGNWLTSLKIEEDHIIVSGLSTNAAQLVELYGKSALFRDVVLNAPITPDPSTQRENFSIAAKIVGRHD